MLAWTALAEELSRDIDAKALPAGSWSAVTVRNTAQMNLRPLDPQKANACARPAPLPTRAGHGHGPHWSDVVPEARDHKIVSQISPSPTAVHQSCGCARVATVWRRRPGSVPVTEVAERFEVWRQAVHRWIGRYRDEDAQLHGEARRPHAGYHPVIVEHRQAALDAAYAQGAPPLVGDRVLGTRSRANPIR